MNIEAETDCLLRPTQLSKPSFCRKIFGVEFLMFLYGIIDLTESSVMKQFIYHKVKLCLDFFENEVSGNACNYSQSNATEKYQSDKVQYLSLNYVMGISLGFSIAVLFTSPFHLIVARRFGRRILIIYSGIGFFIKSVCECLLIFRNWSLDAFIYIETLHGLTGGAMILYSVCFSLLANASKVENRNLRIVCGVIASALGAAIGSVSTGYMIKTYGFLPPFIVATIISVGCVSYPIFCLEKSKPEIEEKLDLKPTILEFSEIIFSAKNILSSFTVVLLMFGFFYVGETAASEILYYIFMSYPICMNSIQIGYSISLEILVLNIGLILSGTILNKYLNELVVILICLSFGLLFNIQMIYAKTVKSIYIAFGSNVLSSSAFPFIKGYLSKLTAPNLQTYLFIGLTVLEVFLGCLSKSVVIILYQRTLEDYQETVYLILTCFTGVAFMLSLLIGISTLNHHLKLKIEHQET
uniref:Slc46a-4 n=1 Tax=Schmidtea mediterranea TaxID=79327 RepID=A0A0H3YJH7_SCHMD|nr:slc46a-4 [Schmidtea mediterranea]